MGTKIDKEALSRLREARKAQVESATEKIRMQASDIRAIRAAMKNGAGTVPDIARETGMETARVLLYVTGLRKYGIVAEGAKEGDYYTYNLVQEGPEAP